MKYTTYLKKSGMTNNEVIELLKPHFPKFSKIQCSMLSHPEEYGVQLTAQAKKLLPALPKTPRTAKPKTAITGIVFCKDCLHRERDSWCECVEDDFFCKRGERK